MQIDKKALDQMNSKFREDIKKINNAVDAFTEAIKERLLDKYIEGYHGWDGEYQIDKLIEEINEDANDLIDSSEFMAKTVSIDIGARAMMIFFRVR